MKTTQPRGCRQLVVTLLAVWVALTGLIVFPAHAVTVFSERAPITDAWGNPCISGWDKAMFLLEDFDRLATLAGAGGLFGKGLKALRATNAAQDFLSGFGKGLLREKKNSESRMKVSRAEARRMQILERGRSNHDGRQLRGSKWKCASLPLDGREREWSRGNSTHQFGKLLCVLCASAVHSFWRNFADVARKMVSWELDPPVPKKSV
ncbi:hypothetical protein QQ056_06395 [Oscillatoria laete-virens NRMC-F 0139]|nr:hypothetical protein [Oscillatoria laete-virens]MDL5053174.1 hypothetical protein [Oscillatoria laete-virens NRMC-F 0139]